VRWLVLAIAACSPAPAPAPATIPIEHTAAPPPDAAVRPIAVEASDPPPLVGPDAVLAAVHAHAGIRRCFDRTAESSTGQRLALHVEIAASGDVTLAKMTGVTVTVATCIEDAVRRMHFPAQPDGAAYDIPFTD